MTAAGLRGIEAALATEIGGVHVRAGEAAAAYAVDGHAPRWAVFPGSLEEVSRCLALASRENLAVAPTGHGTRRGWGNPPRALDLVLSLERLDRILAHEPADLTVSVQAGLTLGSLDRTLRPHRQLLPLDPAQATGSTIGGIVATAASGPYRARYGTVRELLLGVTVVLGDGTVVRGGGRVVKNATGYDMPKLQVGALGTLGVIVEAHLRLHPAPTEEATWLFGFPTAEAVVDAALGVLDAPLAASRLQFLDAPTLVHLGHAGPPAAALAVAVGSVPESVRDQGARIAEIVRPGGGTLLALTAPDAWWPRVSDATRPDAGEPALALRVGVRSTDVVKALRAVQDATASTLAPRATAELANGVLHVVLQGDGARDAAAHLRRVREALAPLEATCVVEHAPADAKAGLDVWGDVGPALSVMHRVKAELDPPGRLNPGRFVGGI